MRVDDLSVDAALFRRCHRCYAGGPWSFCQRRVLAVGELGHVGAEVPGTRGQSGDLVVCLLFLVSDRCPGDFAGDANVAMATSLGRAAVALRRRRVARLSRRAAEAISSKSDAHLGGGDSAPLELVPRPLRSSARHQSLRRCSFFQDASGSSSKSVKLLSLRKLRRF